MEKVGSGDGAVYDFPGKSFIRFAIIEVAICDVFKAGVRYEVVLGRKECSATDQRKQQEATVEKNVSILQICGSCLLH